VESSPPYGTLRGEVLAAASAQVYVDGYFVGTADQAAVGLDLEPGPHRVEVRAAGYDPLTFDVRITPNQVITYRDAMRPAANAAATPEHAAAEAAGRERCRDTGAGGGEAASSIDLLRDPRLLRRQRRAGPCEAA